VLLDAVAMLVTVRLVSKTQFQQLVDTLGRPSTRTFGAVHSVFDRIRRHVTELQESRVVSVWVAGWGVVNSTLNPKP
jgi:hypothetical protein